MSFQIAEYLRQTEFEQTRESDKRDIFEKDYYHPFHATEYKAIVTIHYNAGYSEFNNASIWLMDVQLKNHSDSTQIYAGLSPQNFDFAAELFESILPSKKELQKYNE